MLTFKTKNTYQQWHYKIMREKLSTSKAKECEGRFAVRSSSRILGGEQVQIVKLDKQKFLAEFYEALNFASLFQDKEGKKSTKNKS